MKANVILLTGMITFFLISCGDGSKELVVKNNSNEFTGELNDYLEVVDGNYSISDAGYDLVMTAKFKVLKPIEDGIAFSSIRAEVLDESGMPLPGANTFVIAKDGWTTTETDNVKIDNALTEGEGEVTVQFKYDTYSTGGGSLGEKEFMKIAGKKGNSFRIISSDLMEEAPEQEAYVSETTSSASDDDSESESSTTSSGDSSWDELLVSYEKYIDQYITFLKKANAGDVSAMSQYPSMMAKAADLQEKIMNASDDLSIAQMNKFNKLQAKMINAAAELSTGIDASIDDLTESLDDIEW